MIMVLIQFGCARGMDSQFVLRAKSRGQGRKKTSPLGLPDLVVISQIMQKRFTTNIPGEAAACAAYSLFL